MGDTAVQRPGYSRGSTPDERMRGYEQWLTQQRRANPNFQAPKGYEWKGDHYERDTHGAIDDIAKYLPYAGMAAAGGIGAAGAFGGGGAAAASGMPSSLPGISTAVSVPGATSAGGAGMLGGFGLKDAFQLFPSVLGMFKGHDTQPVPYSGEMEALLKTQRQRMEATSPLYEAVLKMAMGMMPTQYRAGGMPGMPTQSVQRDAMPAAQRRQGY